MKRLVAIKQNKVTAVVETNDPTYQLHNMDAIIEVEEMDDYFNEKKYKVKKVNGKYKIDKQP